MRSKYTNDYKKAIIDLGIDVKVKKIKKDLYKQDKTIISDDEGIVDQVYSLSWEQWKKEHVEQPKYDCAIRLLQSSHNKIKKIRKKVRDLIEDGNAIFITLTFTDDVLAKTSPLTRRRYVARYLKQQSDVYVANIDFSPKQREHYHAIVGSRCNLSQWSYGYSYAEQIRNQDKDVKRTTNYVAKLTNHALKVNATRLIYSRDVI